MIDNDDARTGYTKEALRKGFLDQLNYSQAVSLKFSHGTDKYIALANAVRDRIVDRLFATKNKHEKDQVKSISYFSFEFLMGRALESNMLNLGIYDKVMEFLKEDGIDWKEFDTAAVDSGLGNGGLGRLAACFLDSLATLEIPSYGYGLRYKYGFFKQEIRNGYQVETADDWLKQINPWEIRRNDISVMVEFGGRVARNKKGRCFWVETTKLMAVPYDTPIIGYGGNIANTLRLWEARSPVQFNLEAFNKGEYYDSLDQKAQAESLTSVLYPNDAIMSGKELRFRQQYFFVSASLQDIFRRFKTMNLPIDSFPEKVAIQLNDTHPSIAVAELMRLLVDEEQVEWNRAWDITVKTFGYTNHTLMPEALETWPVEFFERHLPRHLEIIYGINHFFLQMVSGHYPGDGEKLSRLSLIQEGEQRRIRMAHLAILGSHSVNGVAEIHSRLVKEKLVPEFYALFPDRFNNKTNGITQRRWLLKANRPLAELITQAIGDKWITDLTELRRLDNLGGDAAFLEKLAQVKRQGKVTLSNYCIENYGFGFDPDSLMDVQVKRIHEYKRQLLNILHIIALYERVRAGEDIPPRTFVFAGKAAPAYEMAKLIIKLVNNISQVINGDRDVRNLIKVFFLPNYNVSLAELIFPASDISEQISTAGTEASGTSNMKFMLNGALTMGTLDGANIEIMEEAGKENMFIFGLTAEEVEDLRRHYDPHEYFLEFPEIKQVIDLISGGYFSISEPGIFNPIVDTLSSHDYYMHIADLPSYIEAQKRASEKYKKPAEWYRASLANIAHSGKFSSDRTIAEYAREIWNIKPCHVDKP
ncbi:MAG: glycogen/starch/alpha-glucan phosphorylase [Spirochaetales bacterium]|nr:glycogen/starch/alpha-glucan phosphorylase [Spirochaetales bacterium]